ncbi:barstar family protein [Lysobacter sp. H23M47]|uniref:barstar family protein n=1 Tax=Lysobacter sp. H23M47 TaxID=2781024 RepID=UPI001D169531|nr:barstar family protein [Lysobacter sp. H23M47]
MPTDIRALLLEPDQARAFFIDGRDSGPMAEAAASLDFAIARIDLAGCTGKADALERIARGLSFPGWFGGNWDALADCLGDLSWLLAPGYMLLIANSGAWRAAQPEEFDTLLAILNEAALEWRERNVAFWALLPLAAEAMKALENAIESPPDSEASYSGP